MSSHAHSSPNHINAKLVGASGAGEALTSETYRRYYNQVTTQTVVNGVPDIAVRATVYKIGYRFAPASEGDDLPSASSAAQAHVAGARGKGKHVTSFELKNRLHDARGKAQASLEAREARYRAGMSASPQEALQPLAPDFPRYMQTTFVGEKQMGQFSSAARAQTPYSGDFGSRDLSAIIERAGMALAVYANVGLLSMSDLAGGRRITLTSISVLRQPITAADAHVWFPRVLDSVSTPHAVAALTAICAGVGSTAVTDLVAVNADGEAQIPQAADAELAFGILSLLWSIGSSYDADGYGSTFAYALAKGVYRINTVVG